MPSRILVVYASRYGSTQEVAEAVTAELRATGLVVDVQPVTAATHTLLNALETTAPPKDREIEAAKARARSARRFGN